MKKNIALVLSSGGARGCAHIGAIKILKENGFNITSIAGTSMGALVGGIYATGQLQQFEEWISSLDIMEVLKLTDFSISRKGLVKGKKVIERIKEIVPERNIEDLSVPFCAVATDILNGTETVFAKGNLYEAIRASISIPTVFQPQKIEEHYYVDGGLLNPIPVNRVKRHAGDLLVVVNVSSPICYETKKIENEPIPVKSQLMYIDLIRDKFNSLIPTKNDHDEDISIFNLTNRSISTMMQKISELTLEKNKPDLLINISRDSFSTYDFYKAKEIIKEGELATLRALESFHKKSRK
ncbi:MAG: patatin-like phospholipase family protein [Bacteroidales bacterium]|nr:patatin-like phospholipase family protein [Bacteroidales bacterium]MDD4604358.1 patatin-like phospholipase family protein [Bacteroidales bacterium]